MTETEKSIQISILVTDLFNSKGKKNDSEMVKTWIKLLRPFDLNDLRMAFLSIMTSSEGFPNVGMIIEMVTSNTVGDALEVWRDFEMYCIAKTDCLHFMDGAIERTKTHKDQIGESWDTINMICSPEKFIGSDNFQREQFKKLFIKEHQGSKIINNLKIGDNNGNTKSIAG